MFNRNLPPSNDPPEPPVESLVIPEPRIVRVTERVGNNDEWRDIDYEAHTVQTTESGGLNLIRIMEVLPGMVGQHLVVGLAAGEWRRVREILDLSKTSRFTLH